MERPPDRQTLVSALLGHLDDPARAGVLITGPVGVGKSFVADRVASELSARGHSIRRVNGAGESDLPLAALARAFSNEEAYAGVAPIISMKRFLHAHDGPMTVVVDDVDLLDAPSLATVIEVASAGLVTLILTLRSGSEYPPTVEHAVTSGSLYRVECQPLDRQSSASLADEFAGRSLTARTHRRLYELSQGNPLFVRELVEASRRDGRLVADGSDALFGDVSVNEGRLVDLLEQRVRSLDVESRDALTRIAVVGIVGHGEINGFVSDDVLERLERRDLITSNLDGRRMAISIAHALDGEILRSTASAVFARHVRSEHASRIKEFGSRRSHDRLRLATWALDGVSSVDARALDEASRLAASAGDAHLSRRFAEAAFQQHQSADTAHLLGVTLTAVGDTEALVDHLRQWEPLATTPSQRSQYENLSANTRYWRLSDGAAVENFADTSRRWPDPSSKAAIQAAAASMLVTTGRIDDAVALADGLHDVPPGIPAVHAALALGHGWRAQGKPSSAAALVADSLDFFRSISDDAFILSDVAMAGLLIQTLSEAGRFVELDRLIAERSESWIDLGKTPTSALVLLAQASAWFVRGDGERAIRFATDGRDRFDEIRQVGMSRWCLIMLALAHAAAGRIVEAASVVNEIERHGDHPAQIFESALARSHAWTHHHRGDVTSSSEILLEAVDTARSLGNISAALDCLHDLARQRNAMVAAERLDDIAISDLEGDYHAARCAHIQALAGGDVRELGTCMTAFDRLGLRHLAAECAVTAAADPSLSTSEAQRLLRQAAERTGSREIDFSRLRAHESLTSREREVAALAVEGLTSRQIADQLAVSRRTIESHLGSTYAKLGIDGRIGLVERLT